MSERPALEPDGMLSALARSGPRVVWYALGGGMGHLQRTLAILRHFRPLVPEAGLLLLTSSAYSHLAIQAGVPVMRVPGAKEAGDLPRGAVAVAIAAVLRSLGPLDLLVVDTFADGLHNELTPELLGMTGENGPLAPLAARCALIWRPGVSSPADSPLWPHYGCILAPMPTITCPGVEPVGWVLARRPDEALAPADARRCLGFDPNQTDQRVVLCVHAGEPGEVIGFFEHVQSAQPHLPDGVRLCFATPLPLPGFHGLSVLHPWPAAEVFPGVDLLVSGAGYNSHTEARAFGLRHVLHPFRRSHDDQAARAGEARVIHPLDSPEQVATTLLAALDSPAPEALSPAQTNGAAIAAERLATYMRTPV